MPPIFSANDFAYRVLSYAEHIGQRPLAKSTSGIETPDFANLSVG
jgi:hypothetical protein